MIDAAIEILRRDNPEDMRDGQLVFIERAVNVGILQRDGMNTSYRDEVLACKHGTTKGDTYLRHDMVTHDTAVHTFIFFLVVFMPY